MFFIARLFAMSSSFPLVLDEWSDTDSMVSLHSLASSWTSTRATLKSISSASSLSSYEEEQPINDMMFKDHRLPLLRLTLTDLLRVW